MTKVNEVYTGESYEPFLDYCEAHHYVTMSDLARCPFSLLIRAQGITPGLASRVKVQFEAYRRAHPEEFPAKAAPMRLPTPRTKANGSMSELELATALKDFFEQNGERLITVAEAAKQVAGRAKRSEVVAVLEKASWCQAVDSTTFYYIP